MVAWINFDDFGSKTFFERAQFYLQKCLVPKQVLRADRIIFYYLTSKTEVTKGDGNLDPWKTEFSSVELFYDCMCDLLKFCFAF